MTPPDPTPPHPIAEPDAPISVADILRREGLRGPHAASGPLRPRGHAAPPIPTLSAPRPGGPGRRVTVAAAALTVAGVVFGATAVQEALPRPPAADGAPGAATGIASGRSGPVPAPAPLIRPVALLGVTGEPRAVAFPADLAALARDTGGATVPAGSGERGSGAPGDGGAGPGPGRGTDPDGEEPGGDGPGSGDGPIGDGPGSGGGPGGAGPDDDGPGGDRPDGDRPDGDGPGGDGPGGDGPGGDGPGGDGPGGDGPGGGGPGAPTTVALPELRAPAAVPGAPATRPGAVTVTADEATVTGPAVTTEEARLGPVAVGAAGVDGPDLGVSTSGAVLSEAEIETPALDVAGVGLDLPDVGTPPLRLPLG